VATTLMIFLKINGPISDWYGGRHTCHTASGATDDTELRT